jgi:hypothetical protein
LSKNFEVAANMTVEEALSQDDQSTLANSNNAVGDADEQQKAAGSKNSLDQLKQCLQLLAPKSKDEDKFVALVILPKLLDPTDTTAVHFVFDRMNFKFITRLLKTPALREYTYL